MPRRTTMQQLCTEIQTGDVRSYLLANDWRVAEPRQADAVFFEKDSDDDQSYRVWIWASRDRPKGGRRPTSPAPEVELDAELKPLARDARLQDIDQTLVLVDGSLIAALPSIMEASWRKQNKGSGLVKWRWAPTAG